MPEEITSILLIDDDPSFLEMVKYALIGTFQIMIAQDGKAGLDLAKKKLPSLILLDRTMPKMDGLEVLLKLKADKKTKEIPVFMLTGKTTLDEIDKAFEYGADDYITKPVDLAKLPNMLRLKARKVHQ